MYIYIYIYIVLLYGLHHCTVMVEMSFFNFSSWLANQGAGCTGSSMYLGLDSDGMDSPDLSMSGTGSAFASQGMGGSGGGVANRSMSPITAFAPLIVFVVLSTSFQ